jgi:hypothetical protein
MAIWMKTKFDRGMNMDIPHSPNIACAMYGFRELGAEIIPYHSLDEIYDKVQREDIVLDYILQCNEIFKKFGVEPYVPDYPEKLTKYLGRKIWEDTIDSISRDEKNGQQECLLNPRKTRCLPAKLLVTYMI